MALGSPAQRMLPILLESRTFVRGQNAELGVTVESRIWGWQLLSGQPPPTERESLLVGGPKDGGFTSFLLFLFLYSISVYLPKINGYFRMIKDNLG